MKLHRTGRRADWAKIAAVRRNGWQKLAAGSRGVLTPGNLFTIVGFGLVALGLVMIVRQQYWTGLVLLAIGRGCDLLDGWLAERSGTKSPLGEKLDAGFDKLATLLTGGVFIACGILPIWAVLLLLVPHLVITAISAVAYRRQMALHPSRTGKLSMAVAWAALLGYVCAAALWPNTAVMTIAHALTVASAAMATSGAIGYGRRLFRSV